MNEDFRKEKNTGDLYTLRRRRPSRGTKAGCQKGVRIRFQSLQRMGTKEDHLRVYCDAYPSLASFLRANHLNRSPTCSRHAGSSSRDGRGRVYVRVRAHGRVRARVRVREL